MTTSPPLHLVASAQDRPAQDDTQHAPANEAAHSSWRTRAADLCFITLRASTFLGSSYLMALGMPLVFFLAVSGGDGESLFAHLANLAERFRTADYARQVAFLGEFAGADRRRDTDRSRAPAAVSEGSRARPFGRKEVKNILATHKWRGFAFSPTAMLLAASMIGSTLWGVWATDRLLTLEKREVVTVQLSRIMGEFIEAEARAGRPLKKPACGSSSI